MRLILTRHGETEENILGIMQGHLPGKLSKLGIEQAKKVALRLKDEKIDYIYSSDLARAADTAREIAKYHPKAKIEFVTDLREKYLGEYQGKTKKDFGWDTNEMVAHKVAAKDGETTEQMFKRAEDFLHKVLAKHPKDTVLFVGHNGINCAVIAAITGKKAEDVRNIETQKNTSVNIFEIDEDRKHKIHVFNCTKHLD